MKRFFSALIVLAALFSSPAAADVPPVPYTGAGYTYNGLTAGSYGGVLYRGGRYYAMTVGHVAGPLYSTNYEYKPNFYRIGGTAYNAASQYGGASGAEDIALIEMGTVRPNPRIRVCNLSSCVAGGISIPQVATIDSVPTGADLAYGATICQSGFSNDTQSLNGYRCGWADNVGDYTCQVWCGISTNDRVKGIASSGDSGAPVWQPLPNGHIRLLGFMSDVSGTYPYTHAYYRPVWHYTTHNWTASQSCDYCSQGPGGTVLTGSY